tara:strand:+ start:161 stop:301 length:141 start_codon:yes stop_codon:yes gene_type:complete
VPNEDVPGKEELYPEHKEEENRGRGDVNVAFNGVDRGVAKLAGRKK